MKKIFFLILCLFVLFFFIPRHARALTGSIDLDGGLSRMAIGLYMEYLVDRDGGLGIDDVLALKDEAWTASTSEVPAFGYWQPVYWERFRIENKTGSDIDFNLEVAYPLIESLNLYIIEGGRRSMVETGCLKPFNTRPVDYRNFVFPLKLKARSKASYYLRFCSESAMNTYLYLWSPSAFEKYRFYETVFLGMLYAVMMVMALYNLFIFFSIRDKSYLFYILFIVSVIFFMMAMEGTAYQYLWPNSIWWGKMCVNVFVGIVNFSIVMFALYYINAWQFKGRPLYSLVIRLLYIMAALGLIHTLGTLVLDNFKLAVLSSATVTSINTSLGAVLALVSIFLYRSREAVFFLIGFALFIIGALFFALKEFAVLPPVLITTYGVQIGAVLSVVLLSFALADRINVMRKAIQAAHDKLADLNRNLEKKVEERTAELKTTMEAMESMNEELNATNEELEAINVQLLETRDQLWGEMQIAKKIQTVLLPQMPHIPGYRISVFMHPADEVGGDYYDIINAGGYHWIVIGDVSGHGVPAGLIMMMVQTSINLVISREPDISPSKLLSAINSTIYTNLRRMKEEDKYMTITVLAAIKDGMFQFSGLHQDILLYRSATGTVESVETVGMWLGVLDNLEGMNRDKSLSLNVGDAFLLYTDGITEAWREGSVKEKRTMEEDMYGYERLSDVFASLGSRQPDEIRDGILGSLKGYSCPDDVTLVVLKRVE